MGIETDIAMFTAKLNGAIQTAMEGVVADTAKAFLSDAVETEVYDKYDPTFYERKGYQGGLADPANMEARYDPASMTLEVEDVRQDEETGRLVAPIVESGRGYDYFSPGARPFHEVAERNIAESGTLDKALNHVLRSAGFDAETK